MALSDGAPRLQGFRKITLPRANPALLAVALFTFAFDRKANLKPLPVGPQGMVLGDLIAWGQLMVASIIMAVPVVILYG